MTAIQVNTPQLPSPRLPASRLRLTRRGRFVLTSLIAGPLAVLVLATALNGGIAAAGTEVSAGTQASASTHTSAGTFDYITVQAGQSLWELAETVAPAADPREVISGIVRLNQLENSELHPGDRIAIPVEYRK